MYACKLFITSANKTSRARSNRPVSCSRLSVMTPSFLYIRVKTKRIWQPYRAIKQTIISLLKTRAFTCLVFMFLSVPRKTLSGPPCLTANKMCVPVFLPPSPFSLYVCLSVCLYLFISAFWALLSSLLIFVNMGLTSTGQVSPLK